MGRRSGPPGPPSRDFGYSLEWLRTSPGARKEKIRRGEGELPAEGPSGEGPPVPEPPVEEPPVEEPQDERWPSSPRRRGHPPAPDIDFDGLSGRSSGYSSPAARKERLRHRPAWHRPVRQRPAATGLPELHAASAFSFLAGTSLPEDLAARAAELEIPAVALLDRNGLYGMPRFHQAARRAGLRAIVGAEVEMENWGQAPHFASHRKQTRRLSRARNEVPVPNFPRLSLLVAERSGYRNLCRLLTAAARDRPKGEARASLAQIEAHAGGLWCLTGGAEGPLARALASDGADGARRLLEGLVHLFDGRVVEDDALIMEAAPAAQVAEAQQAAEAGPA